MKRGNMLKKIAIAVVVLTGLGWLFLRTVQEARATPYTVRAADLRGWQVVADSGSPAGALVGIRPSPAFTADLFKQIFARNMESITAPAAALVAVVLQREVEALGGVQAEDVVDAIRSTHIEQATLVPRCLAARRLDPPASYDYYFVVFESTPFEAARRAAHASVGSGQSGFDPAALVPTLVIATSDPAARGMLPFMPDPEQDCVAPVSIE
jgi:hypothetical protein